jgi:exo-1,4-beta-D-glucosaminidase
MAPLPFAKWGSLLLATSSILSHTEAAIVSSPGQIATIPSWKVQSVSKSGTDPAKLSQSNFDTSSWYSIGSKGTLMSTLIENKVYNETDIFFSTNLQKVDIQQFYAPWFYRSEFEMKPANGSRYQLKTHGISSRADIWLNGKQVANNNTQAGAYTGLKYDITSLTTTGKNVLLVRVERTDYNRDFALGFVDWNPYPPDNGTGIWRDIEIKQTGSVSLSTPRVISSVDRFGNKGNVSVKINVKSWEEKGVQGEVVCKITDPSGKEIGSPRAEFRLASKGEHKVSLDINVAGPQVWWPKQWGSQPLYTTVCTASTGAGLSDTTPKTKFGIRTVTSTLSGKDTTFYVNEKRFQVLGAGYTSDMFLRFSPEKLRAQFAYMLDMGLNTVRLEGKQEHPYLYELADEIGLMVMAGWECCDKWEGWSYNNEGSGEKWKDADYAIANASLRHEAEMMQHHPSMLTFLVGSDFWPDDRATKIYVDALKAFDWDTPIISSASQRGFPKDLGNGGMKMEGPYDWVAPGYWYDNENRLGSAAGFASELGAGVGTPELSSLKRFLSQSDLDDLWKSPNKGLYHMSTSVSQFYTREIYNTALWARYGAPTSLDDYLMKAQMMDYEATRAQFEAYASRWDTDRPATGLIYWMLNNAWPSLHWNLFDYYLHPWGSYFGAKIGSRDEHVAYDPVNQVLYLINRNLDRAGQRTVEYELLSLNGTVLGNNSFSGPTEPNTSKFAGSLPGVNGIEDIALLKLILHNRKETLSRNVYWVSAKQDVLNWADSTWYHTPTTSYADYKALNTLQKANVSVAVKGSKVALDNKSKVPAVFVRLNLVDAKGNDVVPVTWSDNYVTLWPGEKLELEFSGSGGAKIEVLGKNVEKKLVNIG